jgi:hypothetical protein
MPQQKKQMLKANKTAFQLKLKSHDSVSVPCSPCNKVFFGDQPFKYEFTKKKGSRHYVQLH